MRNNGNKNILKLVASTLLCAILFASFGAFALGSVKKESPQSTEAPTESTSQSTEATQPTNNSAYVANGPTIHTTDAAANTKPYFRQVCVSSILPKSNGISYGPDNLIDKKPHTAWVEGADGDGIYENISVKGVQGKVKGIKILNGYNKSKDIYYKNNRVAELVIYVQGQEIVVSLNDIYGEYNMIYFDEPIYLNGTEIILQITDIYEGSKYDDTCIREIELF